MFLFELQKTKESFFKREGTAPFWIKCCSESHAPTGEALRGEPVCKFAVELENSMRLADGEEAQRSSKWLGGADCFYLKEFTKAAREGLRLATDVDEAMTWFPVLTLSSQPAHSVGQPLIFPGIAPGKAGTLQKFE